MKTILYYSKQENQYFIDDLQKDCELCNNIIKDFGFVVVTQYKNKHMESRFVCLHCMKDVKISALYDRKAVYQFHIMEIIPKDAIPILSYKIDIKGHIGIDTGDIHKIDSDETIDLTRYAGRESFEGATIGKNVDPLLEHKDAEISSEDEFDKLLNQQLNSIPFEDKDKLEYKKT